jgi:hypothetical protein
MKIPVDTEARIYKVRVSRRRWQNRRLVDVTTPLQHCKSTYGFPVTLAMSVSQLQGKHELVLLPSAGSNSYALRKDMLSSAPATGSGKRRVPPQISGIEHADGATILINQHCHPATLHLKYICPARGRTAGKCDW